MGAGASVDKATQDAWKGKIMGATSRQQMLTVMADMKKAIRAGGLDKEDQAAQKMQAIQRGRMARAPVKSGSDLKTVFAQFANYGRSKKQKSAGDMIESSKFRKMMQNAKFINKGMNSKLKKGKMSGNKCDQEHTEYCKKGSKSTKKALHFDDFIAVGVPQMAQMLLGDHTETPAGPELCEEFCRRLCTNGKPKAASGGTKAEYNKFYDDKSTWTGVATRGGPSTSGDQITLQGMMNRKEGDLGN
jgi:hypothetical protein